MQSINHEPNASLYIMYVRVMLCVFVDVSRLWVEADLIGAMEEFGFWRIDVEFGLFWAWCVLNMWVESFVCFVLCIGFHVVVFCVGV